ncbi:MAG TPA: prolipoprotein diacylglyceryl transferase [Polyangia bacterium]|jgi:phosphatidylglycerol:prolipoprotein diacylglycerol transferase
MRPVLFHIPLGFATLPLYSYGLMLALSLIVGWYITLELCERDGMDRLVMGRCYMWTAGSALAGARLLYVLTNLDRFDNFIDIFKVWQGGLVAYGGFLGGFVGAWVFCRVHKIRLLAWADCAVPSLCTGLMITRIGCLLYGCDFGKPFDGRWSITFPKDSPAYNQQVKDGIIHFGAAHAAPVHPTQLYESLNGLILFCLLMLVRRYRKFSGEMFVAFTMGYAVLRYFVEVLRADEQRGNVGPLSTSQFIGVTTFLAGAALLVYLFARYRKDPHAMQLWTDGQALAGATPAPTPSAPASMSANAEKRRRKKRS